MESVDPKSNEMLTYDVISDLGHTSELDMHDQQIIIRMTKAMHQDQPHTNLPRIVC
jgi:hypothetical protein